MAIQMDERVLALALPGPIAPGLARVLLRYGWPLARVERPAEALRDVWRGEPDELVVQIAPAPRERDSIELLSLLHDSAARLLLLAVGPPGGGDVEVAARSAGADGYVPGNAEARRIGELALGLLPDGVRAPAR